MMSTKDGGPAFPSGSMGIGDGDAAAYVSGMSLRDWFAGQALAGFLADGSQRLVAEAIENSAERSLIQDTVALAAVVNNEIARGVYALADAMLKARESSHA